MANTVIQIKSSGVTGNVPSVLQPGELAINYVDGKLFYGNSSSQSVLFDAITEPSGLDGEIQFNDSGTFGASASLTYNSSTETLSTVNLNIEDLLSNNITNISSTKVTTTTVAQVILDSWQIINYRSAKYYVQITSGTSYHVIELSLVHDDTTVYMAQYGELRTSDSLGIFDATITSGNLNVLFTPTNNNTTISCQRILLKT